jgi:hypothetical protein
LVLNAVIGQKTMVKNVPEKCFCDHTKKSDKILKNFYFVFLQSFN